MRFRPLNDHVIIIQDANEIVDDNAKVVEAVKSGLIVLPDKNPLEKSSNKGTVVSWGSRCHYPWKEGARIMFGRFGGANFTHEGTKYRVLKEWEIVAVYEP